MKKAISILIICLSCYLVYNLTSDETLYYLNIGDGLAMGITSNNITTEGYGIKIKKYLENKKKYKGYNDSFTNKDYRITDVLKSIKYHEKIVINNDEITINELLKKADIITISLGMNELYYKLLLNKDNIYTYINSMLEDMEQLLEEVNRYNHKKIIVLGYYNITNSNADIFTYINYNLSNLVKSQGFEFIDLNKVLNNTEYFNENSKTYYPKKEAYDKIFEIIVDKI